MIDEIKEHKALIVFFGVNTIFLKFELLDKSNTMTRCSRVILNIFHTFNEMRYGHWQQFSCWHQRWENPTFRKKLLKTHFQIKDKYKQSTPWLRVILILFPKPVRTVDFLAQNPPKKVQKRDGINCPEPILGLFLSGKKFPSAAPFLAAQWSKCNLCCN